MTNVVSMPDQSRHHVEASEWVSRIDAGLTQAEELEFKGWLSRDDRNRDAFIYLAHLWDDMQGLSRLADLFPNEEAPVTTRVQGSRFAIAASLALVCLIAAFVLGQGAWFSSGVDKSYETSVGEHSTVSLPDGSQLVLNTNSLVTVSYKEDYRLVTLERGEIHIEVEHDEARPLSVKAGGKVVQAVGTAFNIELFDDRQFELIVTDGKVRVGDRAQFEASLAEVANNQGDAAAASEEIEPVRLGQSSLAVSKGERILLGVQAELEALEKIPELEIEAVLSWRQGNLAFNGESLEEAISEISRYTSTEFVFENEELKGVRIAGLFKSGDVHGLLSALEESFAISSRKIDKEKYSLYR